MSDAPSTTGPDLASGIAASELAEGQTLVGHVGEENVLLVRSGGEIFAIAANCSHYGGPLGDGILTDDAVRCPWHHACFDIRTGEALHAPALSPIACWSVEQQGGKIFVRGKKPEAPKKSLGTAASKAPGKIVIVGGGAAGFAAAERLRREGYANSIVMVSDDDAPPVDRPNLSKDYLAGNAPEEWIPLRPDDFYSGNKIDLRLKSSVAAIDPRAREVALAGGGKLAYDKLLLATGAEPIKLPLPGADLPHVFTLRTLADSRAIIARAANAKRAVVIGASFIGLEAAAALRNRNIEVHVVAPEKVPMERVLGAEMGAFVRALHEEHGVIFHLENTPSAIDAKQVTLKSGAVLEADLVVMGVGVRPRLALAEKAGLKLDRGVVVDQYLQTSAPEIYAAGDIARWPDPHSGQPIRVEHWVVAERQGATAALNMLGRQVPFDAVPFFWSQHYDVPINYVGHAESWDEIAVDGNIAGRDCVLRYKKAGKVLAVTSIYRDRDSLEAEVAMEHGKNP
ncbi:MAG TPA: FAD-dependent oxidoreductase [Stellaceae bacterium]|jgi:NADPH-dependent 2,4-dienoyl-CoA reductase/sulfur reductase-like enzyme/nitrite reductase/ring-hydroxylating ferredoxin subunit